jgi:hypothetical protein
MSCLLALSGSERALEFTMCNPPFFSSLEGIIHSTSTFSPRQVREGVFFLVAWYFFLVACLFTIKLGAS